jgi:hypothetical protein
MSDYVQCMNGHYYKSNIGECPYCPKPDSQRTSGSMDKTQFSSDMGGSLNKTQIFTPSGGQGTGADSNRSGRDLSKTFISVPGGASEGGEQGESVQRETRKLMGWLVSYTIDPMGVDFRIYEGNNAIGRSSDNDICIASDSSVSGRHATILCKKGRFFVKDEMAANGSYLNGLELEIGKPYDMNDNDELRVGDTVFRFRVAF